MWTRLRAWWANERALYSRRYPYLKITAERKWMISKIYE